MAFIGEYIAIMADGKILHILSENLAAWSLPGRKVDAGESIAQAAARQAVDFE
jgi:ADP-ribose pyrophosphatase YjhB (NUDIX family)